MRIHGFLILIVAAIAGCSLYLKMSIINNTGELVKVSYFGREIDSHPGQIASFVYPQEAADHTFQVITGGCAYTYVVPKSPEQYYDQDGFDGVVVAQLESDFQLYLVPPLSKSSSSPLILESIQSDGFPISPAESACSE